MTTTPEGEVTITDTTIGNSLSILNDDLKFSAMVVDNITKVFDIRTLVFNKNVTLEYLRGIQEVVSYIQNNKFK